LTGAVASKRVTEAREGHLKMVGNHLVSVKAQGGLTARHTSRAGTKVGLSDLAVARGSAVWHLDVGSSHPGAGAGPKGLAVRQLKRYVSWVQNVARQFGPYLPQALDG